MTFTCAVFSWSDDVSASKYLPDFGVANYCGFGRQPGKDGAQTMREYQRTVCTLHH
jgi:hypothetical protein